MVNLLADKETSSIAVDFESSKQYYYFLKYKSKIKHKIVIKFFFNWRFKKKSSEKSELYFFYNDSLTYLFDISRWHEC